MKQRYFTYCQERRTGLDRRYYTYDAYTPDRRTIGQRRSGLDRRQAKLTIPEETDIDKLDCCKCA